MPWGHGVHFVEHSMGGREEASPLHAPASSLAARDPRGEDPQSVSPEPARPPTAPGCRPQGLPHPEDPHRMEDVSQPPPLTALSVCPPAPLHPQLLPVLMEGKMFGFFPSLFFQTGDSLGRGIPLPKPPGHLCAHGRVQAHPVVLGGHGYFWALCGGGTPGEGMWGCSAAFSQAVSPNPGSSPPPQCPRGPVQRGKEAG